MSCWRPIVAPTWWWSAPVSPDSSPLLLARAGRNVLVLEALFAGAGATGNTIAKISLLQGTKISKIVAKQGQNRAQQYVEGNREGQEWPVAHCENRGLSVQREDAYTYAQSEKGEHAARAELKACSAAGLAVDWVDEADVPFPFHGGVRLANEAQFDPMPLLDSLIVELDSEAAAWRKEFASNMFQATATDCAWTCALSKVTRSPYTPDNACWPRGFRSLTVAGSSPG